MIPCKAKAADLRFFPHTFVAAHLVRYLRSVEARSIFDINTSWESFAWESACETGWIFFLEIEFWLFVDVGLAAQSGIILFFNQAHRTFRISRLEDMFWGDSDFNSEGKGIIVIQRDHFVQTSLVFMCNQSYPSLSGIMLILPFSRWNAGIYLRHSFVESWNAGFGLPNPAKNDFKLVNDCLTLCNPR